MDMELKIGDRVRIINFPEDHFLLGKIGTIIGNSYWESSEIFSLQMDDLPPEYSLFKTFGTSKSCLEKV
jgi:hypothetical protein